MEKKFKPNYLLDEQMLFSDAKTTLAFQIREELKELNSNIKSLLKTMKEQQQVNKDETPENPVDPSKEDNPKVRETSKEK